MRKRSKECETNIDEERAFLNMDGRLVNSSIPDDSDHKLNPNSHPCSPQRYGLYLFWFVLVFLISFIVMMTNHLRRQMFADAPSSKIVLPDVDLTSLESSLFVIVTACNSESFPKLIGGLAWSIKQKSFQKKCNDCLFIVYDIGLTAKQRGQLRFYTRVTLRTFMRDRYPKASHSHHLYQAIIVEEVSNQFERILWLDPDHALNEEAVANGLASFRSDLKSMGLLSRESKTLVSDEMKDLAEKLGGHISDVFEKPMCDLSVLGVDRSFAGVHELIDQWRGCAVNEDCALSVTEKDELNESEVIFSILLRLQSQIQTALHCKYANDYFLASEKLFQSRYESELKRTKTKKLRHKHG